MMLPGIDAMMMDTEKKSIYASDWGVSEMKERRS
jgi:hypothetical protein